VNIEKVHVIRVSDGSKPGKKTLKKPKLVVLTKDQVSML
jgi:hypothetical protein